MVERITGADDPLLNVEAACAYLGGIAPATLYTWFSRGTVKRTKIGRRVMVRRSELERFIELSTASFNTNSRRHIAE